MTIVKLYEFVLIKLQASLRAASRKALHRSAELARKASKAREESNKAADEGMELKAKAEKLKALL